MANTSLAVSHLCSQATLSGIGDLLRDTQTDVGEIAVGVTGEGSRTAYVELLQSELRRRQRGLLRRHMGRRCVSPLGSGYFRIILFGLADQGRQRRRVMDIRNFGLLCGCIYRRKQAHRQHGISSYTKDSHLPSERVKEKGQDTQMCQPEAMKAGVRFSGCGVGPVQPAAESECARGKARPLPAERKRSAIHPAGLQSR